MIVPINIEELASYVNDGEKTVFFFTADWCGDCRFIKPFLVNRDRKTKGQINEFLASIREKGSVK